MGLATMMPKTPFHVYEIIKKTSLSSAREIFGRLRDVTDILAEARMCKEDGTLHEIIEYLGLDSLDPSQEEYEAAYENKKQEFSPIYEEIFSQIPEASFKNIIWDFSSVILDYEGGDYDLDFKAHMIFRVPEELAVGTHSQYQVTITGKGKMRIHLFTDKGIDCVYGTDASYSMEEGLEILQKSGAEIFRQVGGEGYLEKIHEGLRECEDDKHKKQLRKPFISWLKSTSSLTSIEHYHNPVSRQVANILQ